MKIKCAGCAARFEVPDVYLNRTVKCPKCNSAMVATDKPSPVIRAVPVAVEAGQLPGMAASTIAVADDGDEQLPVFEAVDPEQADTLAESVRGKSKALFWTFAAVIVFAVFEGLYNYFSPDGDDWFKRRGLLPLLKHALFLLPSIVSVVLGIYACVFIPRNWRLIRSQERPYRWQAWVGGFGLIALLLLNVLMFFAAVAGQAH